MSVIACDACNNLREYAPNFVQNGTNEEVCTSLMNNTGLNPGLTVLHNNCDDLHDVNDCLIGRMTDELEAYDVCDWKDYEKKHNSNLYELLKAIICSDCGQWSKLSALCSSIDALLLSIGGGSVKPHYMTPTALFRQKFMGTGAAARDDAWPVIEATTSRGAGCDETGYLFIHRVVINNKGYYWPQEQGITVTGLAVGDVLGYIHKSELVPADAPESQWQYWMRGVATVYKASSIGPNNGIFVALRGYIVINGVEYNTDLKSTYGPDVLTAYVAGLGPNDLTSGALWGEQTERLRVQKLG